MEHQASRPDLLFTSLIAAMPLNVAGAAQSAQPRADDHQAAGCAAMANLPPFPPGSVDTCALTGANHSAGALLHARALASGIYERAALLFD